MQSFKSSLKYLFQITNTLPLLDRINFSIAQLRNKNKNLQFKKTHPDFILPPDYYLYETYKLDYEQYKEDGFVSAKEINEWTSKYLPETKLILEWGCGVSRIIRHYENFVNKDSKLFGCDINNEMIKWNKQNIPNVDFELVNYNPPTRYQEKSYDFVFALSVFTHIESKYQKDWLIEIARILKNNGIFLFTTHGKNYFDKLNESQLKELHTFGSYTITYNKKGHRMRATYNEYNSFRTQIEEFFEILEYYDGLTHIEKVGGQDLWIVKKK